MEEERIELKELNSKTLELLCDEADNDVIANERDEASNYNKKITEEALEKAKTEQREEREQSVSTSGSNAAPMPSTGSEAGKEVNVLLEEPAKVLWQCYY